jgi:hypothetical protein
MRRWHQAGHFTLFKTQAILQISGVSTRAHIIDGSQADSASFGLVYTCKAGWVDVGHAGPGAARKLWNLIKNETGERSPDGQWFRVPFEECMGVKKWGVSLVEKCEGEDFGVRYGLTLPQKESIALSIFLRVSMQFETMQGSFPWSLKTADSSFSVEDLVSNLIGFYRVVRPRGDYVKLCEPVSKSAAEAVWDASGAVGTHKNRQVKAVLFPCADCANSPRAMRVVDLPPHLCGIQSSPSGTLWRRWPDVISPRGCAPTPPLPRTVTVGPGDWLSKIAQHEYGDMFLWPLIYDANRSTIGDNPNLIRPGQVLNLPELKKFSAAQLDDARRRGREWR